MNYGTVYKEKKGRTCSMFIHVCDYGVSICKLPASDFRVVEIIIKITRYRVVNEVSMVTRKCIYIHFKTFYVAPVSAVDLI